MRLAKTWYLNLIEPSSRVGYIRKIEPKGYFSCTACLHFYASLYIFRIYSFFVFLFEIAPMFSKRHHEMVVGGFRWVLVHDDWYVIYMCRCSGAKPDLLKMRINLDLFRRILQTSKVLIPESRAPDNCSSPPWFRSSGPDC
jgi:hypothetical protein